MTSEDSEASKLKTLVEEALRHLQEWTPVRQRRALEPLQEAVHLAPNDNWLWFQIGLLNLMHPDNYEALDIARAAFEQAVALGAPDFIAQPCLGYLKYRCGPYAFDVEFREVLGADPAGTVLRRRGYQGLRSEEAATATAGQSAAIDAAVDVYLARVYEVAYSYVMEDHIGLIFDTFPTEGDLYDKARNIAGTGISEQYLVGREALEDLLALLREVAELVAEDDRGLFYRRIGDGLGGDFARARWWYEQAAVFAERSSLGVDDAHSRLAGCLVWADPPEYSEACRALIAGYDHMMGRWPSTSYGFWFRDAEWFQDWDPEPDDLSLLRALVDRVLDFKPFKGKVPFWEVGEDDIAAWAVLMGRHLLKQGKVKDAGDYYARALQIEPDNAAAERGIFETCLLQRRWHAAHAALSHLAVVDPHDSDVQRILPILELADRYVTDSEAHEQVLAQIAELRAGQKSILEELGFQRELLGRVAEVRASLLHALDERRVDKELAYDRALEQLHSLVQKSARIPPAAWQETRDRLAACLGAEPFAELTDTAQHFLVTAEVVFAASSEVAEQMDAALIAVEYAKVVEVQLQVDLLRPLGRHLDKRPFRGVLFVGGNPLQYGRGNWESKLGSLGLGGAAGLLDEAAKGQNNRAVMTYLQDVSLDLPKVRQFADEISLIANRYRNGAAHTEILDRLALEEFRKLLFEAGLIRRLVALGRHTRTEAQGEQ